MRRSIIFLIGLVILCMTGQPTVAQRSIVPVQEVDMLFAGDIMQHVGQLNMARLPNGRYSYSYYYRHIKDFIKKADISVANLETPIGKKNFSGYPMFCAPDSFLYAIKDAGFNVLLFANNHCCDKGKSGAMHTLNMLDSLGFAHCGVYRNAQERAERYPLVVEKEGMRIAILNYTYGTNGMPVPKPMVVNLIDKKVIAEDRSSTWLSSPPAGWGLDQSCPPWTTTADCWRPQHARPGDRDSPGWTPGFRLEGDSGILPNFEL